MTGTETAGVKLPPPLLYAAGVLAGLGLDRVAPLAPPPGAWALAAGIALLLAGIALDAWAIVTMLRKHTTLLPWGGASHLVTRGPFRISRNPIYLGYALEQAGIALMLGSWWALLLVAPVVLLMGWLVIPREEAHLSRVFGDEYARYRARVRRWI